MNKGFSMEGLECNPRTEFEVFIENVAPLSFSLRKRKAPTLGFTSPTKKGDSGSILCSILALM